MRRVAMLGLGVAAVAVAAGLLVWRMRSQAPRGLRRIPYRAA
jgi:hypothetical protein